MAGSALWLDRCTEAICQQGIAHEYAKTEAEAWLESFPECIAESPENTAKEIIDTWTTD